MIFCFLKGINKDMRIGNRDFNTDSKTYIMGIVNMTPDSFFDGHNYNDVDRALVRIEKMISDGVDIIDIGGESTRPGYIPVGAGEEIRRIIPIIEAVKLRFDIPISVDTYRSDVAKTAISYGADMINDIWGLRYDGNVESMANVIADTGVAACIMHNSSESILLNGQPEKYIEKIQCLKRELQESVNIALDAGVDKERIIIDPGVGFAKDYDMNMAVTANLEELNELGYPVLLGTSNKSVIGTTLDLPVNERMEGTLVTTVFAVLAGCSFIRVHDVKKNKRAADMAAALKNYRNPL